MMAHILCAAALLAVLTLFARSEWEKKHFEKTEYVFFSEKIKKPFSFVFLTDLHGARFGEKNADLLAEIEVLAPDAVLLGGDICTAKHGRADLGAAAELAEGLAGIKGKPRIFYAAGNHEQRFLQEKDRYPGAYEELCGILKKFGVCMVFGSQEKLRDDICLAGLLPDFDIYKKRAGKREQAAIRAGFKNEDGSFFLCLAHSPLCFGECKAAGADLVVSGHFHGGTVRLGKHTGLMTPQFHFFYPRCAGLFRDGGSALLVGRGLGTHSVCVRLNDRPELMFVKLLPAHDGEDGHGNSL